MVAVARSREQVAQQPPADDADLRRFPTRTVRAGATWFREHAGGAGPWWFSSSGAGRFDLPAPEGTCYLASSGAAAVRERLGPELAAHGTITMSLLAGRVVSTLGIPADVRSANMNAAAAARFGVTRELPVMVPYDVPQAWAASLAAAGFGGIVAGLRFTPGRTDGLALFGAAGERTDWPRDAHPTSAVDVAAQLGVHIVAVPRSTDVTVVSPPKPPVRKH